MRELLPDLYVIRGLLFQSTHLLVGSDGLVLIDGGFLGDFRRLQRAVVALGRQPSDLKAILLTHGHIDHTANLRALQHWSGAKLYAPAGDERHIQGRYPYRGVARVCAGLEAVSRWLVRYQPPEVDVWMRDGDELPFWGGMRVVGLHGHTPGHSGFYSKSKRVLFVGDALAVSWRVALPPAIFNTDGAGVKESFRRLATVEADWIVPTHYFSLDRSLVERVRRKAATLK